MASIPRSSWLIGALLLAGCQQGTPGTAVQDPLEPATFSIWPSVTDGPIPVSPTLWMFCRGPTPEEARAQDAAAKTHGPHASHSIVVRVSPEAIAPFRSGEPLPVGAAVVKEKYMNHLAKGPLQEYAVMLKREAGYDPDNGDWEYASVTLAPERKVVRGRLVECASCHASVRQRDYLFRTYGNDRQ